MSEELLTTEELATGYVDIDELPKVHTSDLISFMRCRRRWDWGSYTRQNLEPVVGSDKLYFGSAFHFALEDFHGYREYDQASAALEAYMKGTPKEERVPEWFELLELGTAMLDYYQDVWLEGRDTYSTLWLDHKPQVELHFAIPLRNQAAEIVAVYKGIIDKVCVDAYGRFWILDYKTARQFSTAKLENDPQATGYTWAATQLYGVKFEGMLYQQHLKYAPGPPLELKNNKGLSQNKQQSTTYRLYRQSLKDYYGDAVPWHLYQEFLDYLITQETEDADKFIRRDMVRRNDAELDSFALNVQLMVGDMFSEDLRIYPNPTRDCSWDCDFLPVCLALDDGSDWQQLLGGYRKRVKDAPTERSRIRRR